LLAKRRLPRSSRPDLLFVQPGAEAVLGQLPRDLADGLLVLTVVARKTSKVSALASGAFTPGQPYT
jgi:hypothetical protein